MFSSLSPLQNKLCWLSFAFFMAILLDKWFWFQAPGLAWFIWCVMFVGARYAFEIIRFGNIRYQGLWAGALILILSFFVYIRTSELLNTLNLLTTIYLIFTMWRGYQPTTNYHPFSSKMSFEPFASWVMAISNGFTNLSVFKPKHSHFQTNIFNSILRGSLLSIPVLLIFSGLLSASDSNFANGIFETLANVLRYFSDGGLFRFGFVVFTTVLIYGLGFVYVQNRDYALPIQHREVEKSTNWESTVLFCSIIALFTNYLILQGSYLVGSRVAAINANATYAEFAKRGFFELLIVGVLVFALILVVEKIVFGSKKLPTLSFKLLSAVIIIETFLLLLSAWSKLMLYIQGYGYTNLRLYTQVWIVCMALSFLFMLIRSSGHLPRNIFAHGVLGIFLTGLLVLNIINPEATIASYNLSQSNWNTYEVVNYGPDAYPAIEKLISQQDFQAKLDSNSYCRLRQKIDNLKYYDQSSPWNERNLSKEQAAQVAKRVKIVGQTVYCN
jgi:Domain of unknown function (DUF4173)